MEFSEINLVVCRVFLFVLFMLKMYYTLPKTISYQLAQLSTLLTQTTSWDVRKAST